MVLLRAGMPAVSTPEACHVAMAPLCMCVCAHVDASAWVCGGAHRQGIGEANDVITSAIARDVLEDPIERTRVLAILGGLFTCVCVCVVVLLLERCGSV